MSRNWLSAHIYFDASPYSIYCDDIILNIAKPMVEYCIDKSLIGKYFYVRYNDGISHLRLRLDCEKEAKINNIKRKVRYVISESYPDSVYPEKEFSGLPLRWVSYERETQRYGGLEGVVLAEDFFYHSSKACFEFIKRCNGKGESARLGKALLSMVVLMYSFCRSKKEIARFSHRYEKGYLSLLSNKYVGSDKYHESFGDSYSKQKGVLSEYLSETLSRLETSRSLTDPLDKLHENTKRIKEQFYEMHKRDLIEKKGVSPTTLREAIYLVIPSYIHMNNNRMGISIQKEAFLSYLIRKTLNT
jgi:thiopeptide-type bacteriocin biosynthesis protein